MPISAACGNYNSMCNPWLPDYRVVHGAQAAEAFLKAFKVAPTPLNNNHFPESKDERDPFTMAEPTR